MAAAPALRRGNGIKGNKPAVYPVLADRAVNSAVKNIVKQLRDVGAFGSDIVGVRESKILATDPEQRRGKRLGTATLERPANLLPVYLVVHGFRKAADIAHLPYAEAGMHKMLAGVQQKKYHMVGTAH